MKMRPVRAHALKAISKTCLLIIFLSSIPILFSITSVQSASDIYLHHFTSTTPIIDGNLNSFPSEWAGAATKEFDTIGGASLHGKIYVMNSLTELFIAFEINDGTDDGHNDLLMIIFDNDNDGITAAGDDFLAVNGASSFSDKYIPSDCQISDDPIQHGSGAASFGSSWTFEIRHPLRSGEIGYDFQLSTGSIVGFTIRYWNDEAFSDWPSRFYCPGGSAENYGDIGIDPPPVGGYFTTVNKLAILAPYIALVGLIGIASMTFVIRRRRARYFMASKAVGMAEAWVELPNGERLHLKYSKWTGRLRVYHMANEIANLGLTGDIAVFNIGMIRVEV